MYVPCGFAWSLNDTIMLGIPLNEPVLATSSREDNLTMEALEHLFLVLSTWEPKGSLSLILVSTPLVTRNIGSSIYSSPDGPLIKQPQGVGVEQTVDARPDNDQHRWEECLQSGSTAVRH